MQIEKKCEHTQRGGNSAFRTPCATGEPGGSVVYNMVVWRRDGESADRCVNARCHRPVPREVRHPRRVKTLGHYQYRTKKKSRDDHCCDRLGIGPWIAKM